MLRNNMLRVFKFLGIVIHPSKSQLTPISEIEYLGFKLDIPKQRFLLTEK